MKENIHIVIITLVLFLAGMLTGIWTQKTKATPPPPLPFMGEFAKGPHGSMSPKMPEEVSNMKGQGEKQQSAIEGFEQKLTAIMTDARSKIETVLTPEQKTKFAEFQKDHELPRFGGMPFRGFPEPHFAGLFIYKPQIERLATELKLDDGQRARVDEILKARRQAIIDLLDSNPPPSATFGRRPEHSCPGQEESSQKPSL